MTAADLPLIAADASVREAMALLNERVKGIVLVIDDQRRLLATVTDGDVRRAILDRFDIDRPLAELLARPAMAGRPRPLTAPPATSEGALIGLMNEASVRQVPLVDDRGRVVGLAVLGELVKEAALPLRAVVMAGGFGSRLRPLTDKLPKPMVPLGDRPLLEFTIGQLRDAGIRHVHLTTHYKGELIAEHFADGSRFGVEIHYLPEDRPLGTAGALRTVERTEEPILVINGDILTQVSFRAMREFHREHEADMTVGVRAYKIPVPYGVVASDGVRITGISEKPVLHEFINAGIYLIEPAVFDLIPGGERYDMTDLIARLVADGRCVVSFPIHEYWLDVGGPEEYQRALADLEGGVL